MTEQQRETCIRELVEAQYERNADSVGRARRIEAAVAARVSPAEFEVLLTEAIARFTRRADPVTT